MLDSSDSLSQSSNSRNSENGQSQNPLSEFYQKLASFVPKNKLVIAVYSPSIASTSCFDSSVAMHSLSQEERFHFLKFLLEKFDQKVEEDMIRDLSLRTSSLSVPELTSLLKIASFNRFKSGSEVTKKSTYESSEWI